ncbi:MAG TPA: hypothetical protein ENI32_07455 [Candidatus Syntrophoarchaeum butanivorans]|uniref:Uncharacterized protein n=1 Tax=Candidatus Syntropharchaeum butanivorans TaxID=1839936 RepID=A0A1F2P704_9EURY|nr:MAG: hypothetical protein SBU_000291 [Candidatus Syntrophoarchaeum butanivorans]HEC57692.1 hypothetical protein [Candidatus Syntrophoarchaeum butanivorans]
MSEEAKGLVDKFKDDVVMLDALYQWARNPTSYTAAIRKGCSPDHGLIEGNIEKRYDLDPDKAERFTIS